MPCQVGMTTNLQRRKQQWESKCSNLRNWQKLDGPIKSRQEAQKKEEQYARQYNCDSHAGGDEPDSPSAQWYIYKFEHDGCSG